MSRYDLHLSNNQVQSLKQQDICNFGSSLKANDVIFPDIEIYPVHFKIGFSSYGYWIRDTSK